MADLKSEQRDSTPLRRWFHQTTVWKLWKLSRIVPLRWLLPLTLVAIPLIIILVIISFLFLSLFLLFGFVFYIVYLRPRLKWRGGDEVIEAEYWIESENKP